MTQYELACLERSIQWASLIPGYAEANKNQKKKMKEMYRVQKANSPWTVNFSQTDDVSFGTFGCITIAEVYKNNKPKENTMYDDLNDCCYNEGRTKKQYLESRLWDVLNRKDEELERQFGLRGERDPETPSELVDRITKGLYFIPEDKLHDKSWNILNRIEWRDPSIKKDQEGYNKAKETLDTEKKTVLDTIVVNLPEEGLKALQKWETAKTK